MWKQGFTGPELNVFSLSPENDPQPRAGFHYSTDAPKFTDITQRLRDKYGAHDMAFLLLRTTWLCSPKCPPLLATPSVPGVFVFPNFLTMSSLPFQGSS